jgi:cytochrome c-type biogenesis protein CcmH
MMLRVLLCLMLVSGAVWAVEPSEVLPDPVAEARAREISKELRCLVCRNENIDSSNAGIAKDLRVLVRERITAGDSDEQVIDFVVDRYGEFVLLKPRMSVANLLLWAAGPLMLLIGGFIGWRFTRGDARAEPDALSKAEEKRLKDLLDE